MHPGVSWGDHGYPGVSWGNQTDPFNLVQVKLSQKSAIFSK